MTEGHAGELVERIWGRDPAVWTGSDEAKWLGWLDEPARMRENVELLLDFADQMVDRIDAVVLLGMMKYSTFASGRAAEAPVAYALQQLGAHRFFRSVIVIGALTGMISSLLVFQYGQARIWYAMSRDGLLPKLFSAVHPKYKTPHWSTWIACFAVGIPAGMVDIGDAADLSNIGTLFAFVLVSLGVILLRRKQPDRAATADNGRGAANTLLKPSPPHPGTTV